MRVFIIVVALLAALLLLHSLLSKPKSIKVEDAWDDILWSEILGATKADNDSATLVSLALNIRNESVDNMSINFCDSQKCYKAGLNGWMSINEMKEGYAHPLKILKYVSRIIKALNLSDANVSVEMAHGVDNCYTFKSGFLIPLERLRSKVYVISINSNKFVLWEDAIKAEQVFFIRVLDFDGKPVENAKIIMRSNANPFYNFTAKTNESGVAVLRNRYILKVFEYPFEVIVETDNMRKRVTIFKTWNAELMFSKRTKLIMEKFEVKLDVDSIVERGDVYFKPKLIYSGDEPITIYFGHVHPLRVRVSNESGIVCMLPLVTLDVLSRKSVEPKSEISANMSCKLNRGVYEVIAFAELSAYEDFREEVILRSEPIILRVV